MEAKEEPEADVKLRPPPMRVTSAEGLSLTEVRGVRIGGNLLEYEIADSVEELEVRMVGVAGRIRIPCFAGRIAD